MEVVAFERSMTFKSKGGNHLQFNVLSIPAAAAKKAREVYHAAAKRHGIQLKEVPGPTKVHPPAKAPPHPPPHKPPPPPPLPTPHKEKVAYEMTSTSVAFWVSLDF